MTSTQQLHERGQSIWLDNITRTLLTSGTLARYVDAALGDGVDVESDDFRQGDRGQRRLRRGDPGQRRQR